MKPYNMTKAAIDEFRVTDYRIGSPLVHERVKDQFPYNDVMPLNLQYKRKLHILMAAYNSFCRQYNRNMKPYNMTKAAIDKFRVTDYRIGSPLVHWT